MSALLINKTLRQNHCFFHALVNLEILGYFAFITWFIFRLLERKKNTYIFLKAFFSKLDLWVRNLHFSSIYTCTILYTFFLFLSIFWRFLTEGFEII